jgi:hypothetical protein
MFNLVCTNGKWLIASIADIERTKIDPPPQWLKPKT